MPIRETRRPIFRLVTVDGGARVLSFQSKH